MQERPGGAGRIGWVVAAVVTVALLAGAGTGYWLVRTKNDDALRLGWTKSIGQELLPEVGSGPAVAHATWPYGDLIVRATTGGVAAYRLGDGSRVWAAPVPSGTAVCTAAAEAAGDFGVVAFGAKVCDRLGVVDLRSGTLARTVQLALPRNHDELPRSIRLVAAGGTAVVTHEGHTTAIGAADGRVRWRLADGDCVDKAFAMTGTRVVMLRRCDNGRRQSLAALHPGSGRKLFEVPLHQHADVQNVPSAEPLTAVVYGPGDPYVLTWDEERGLRGEIPWRTPAWNLDLDGVGTGQGTAGIDGAGMTVHGGVLYAVDKTDRQRRVVAIDLATGRLRWKETGGSGDAVILRAGPDGAWAVETGDGVGHLVRVDAESGRAEVRRSGALTAGWKDPGRCRFLEYRGSLVVTPRQWEDDEELPSLTVLR
ncbi:PQQ-binding-like beta-propeller repeat protein [Actinoplanes utahensis]|uniref:Pyrrolo-quinoline quinone repeat domain-containing protein n=1 Tax=Actinoplanes utahensis TaxID=1869 RepID=A0A0A6UGA2_ACTUT|nr:PQQ-binding-like beta-propeller repeat protein [Actinoplanes utahensis]KHD74491.1 hypothetical protein MB27_28680 [Actinoplanes utahensis]GIF31471.1 hypothetical protein Aut01nite_44570 [Actinoplanes utahensis]